MIENIRDFMYVSISWRGTLHLLPEWKGHRTLCGIEFGDRPHNFFHDYDEVEGKFKFCLTCQAVADSQRMKAIKQEPEEKPTREIYHVVRRFSGSDIVLKANLGISGAQANAYISELMNSAGFDIHSVHVLQVVPHETVTKPRWWEFWKSERREFHGHAYDIMWVLVR